MTSPLYHSFSICGSFGVDPSEVIKVPSGRQHHWLAYQRRSAVLKECIILMIRWLIVFTGITRYLHKASYSVLQLEVVMVVMSIVPAQQNNLR